MTLTLIDANNAPVAGPVAFDAASRTVQAHPVGGPDPRRRLHGVRHRQELAAACRWRAPTRGRSPWPRPTRCPASARAASGTTRLPRRRASAADTASGRARREVHRRRRRPGLRRSGSTRVRRTSATHTGSVWTAAGDLLGTVTFTSESSSGWQTAYFSNPVDITAGTTYIASYQAPSGGYAVTTNGLAAGGRLAAPAHGRRRRRLHLRHRCAADGLRRANYWVDVVFVATDAAPTVSATSPGSSVDERQRRRHRLARRSRAQIMNGSAQIGVRDAGGNAVAGSAAYQPTTRTITFTPSSSLTAGTVYTATVSGASALSGNVMSPFSWSFTTAGANACPCTPLREQRGSWQPRLRGRRSRRAGRLVHAVRQRLRHRRAVLQERTQHRDPHRVAVVQHRDPSRDRHVHRRRRTPAGRR